MAKQVMAEKEKELIFLQNITKYVSDNPERKMRDFMKSLGVVS